MKKIIHCFNANVPRPKVYAALVTETGLSSWWSTKVKTNGNLGSIVEFTFLAEFNPHMKIVTRDDPGLLEWKCVAGHEPWADNRFRFALREAEGATEVVFTQDYARELSDQVYGVYNYNWGYYLESLRLYCEDGAGKPFEA